MSSTPALLTPFRLGPLDLPNRVLMAPMTRSRAGAREVPTPLMADYYAQRASAGLLITEATQVSAQGTGYPFTPGIHTPAQVAGWQQVTAAVHAQGGRIFLQLWHVGRASLPKYQPGGALPVGPSAIAAPGQTFTPEGMKDFVTPRALETAEVADLIDQFRQGAQRAKEAGFDGVEIHGANGYIFDQFLQDGSNQRTDDYGGSFENRARLLLETTAAVIDVWGPDRVGVRLSPSGILNGMSDSNPVALFEYIIDQLNALPLAYLHLMEPSIHAPVPAGSPLLPVVAPHFRQFYRGTLIAAGGYDFATANQAIEEYQADLVSFGVLFLANPDLPERFATGALLNAPDPQTLYGGRGAAGYTDYPFLHEATVPA